MRCVDGPPHMPLRLFFSSPGGVGLLRMRGWLASPAKSPPPSWLGGGAVVGWLSWAAHGQVHHENSGHFRCNYQEFHLTINFLQLCKLFLQEKARKRRAGRVLGQAQSSPGEQPPTDTFKFH